MTNCTLTKSCEVPVLSGGPFHGAMNEYRAGLPATCFLVPTVF